MNLIKDSYDTITHLQTERPIVSNYFKIHLSFIFSEFEKLEEATIPEIQRSNLASVILTMLNIGIENIQTFDFMDSPGTEDIASAMRQLRLLGAVGDDNKLSDLGRKMAGFPLDPKLTATILAGAELGCGEEILSIVSLVSGENVFNQPANREKQEEAVMAHKVKLELKV